MNGFPPNILRTSRLPALACGALLCACALGCQTMRDAFNPAANTDRLTETKGIAGPLERMIKSKRDDEVLVDPALASMGRAEYDEAERLHKAGKDVEAEKILKQIARNKKYKNAPVREDALFLIAECQFARKRYSAAQDSYDRLVKDYQSTRYLDRFSKRQFEIARYWLRFPEVVTGDAIQKVNYEDPQKSQPLKIPDVPTRDPTRIIPILPNLSDRTRPVFDTDGRALEALKAIWMNDPTGPLADDALMLSASHYLRKQDWTEADRLYSLLRDEYPKSPHAEQAFILGSHVKLMSYQGPAYDNKKLEEARHLKETTLKLYPKHPERERFLEEIRKIEESLARHDWEMVEYYQRRHRPTAMAIYCQSIMDKYGSTQYADRARQLLHELEAKNAPGRSRIELGPAKSPKPSPGKEPPDYEEPPAKVRL